MRSARGSCRGAVDPDQTAHADSTDVSDYVDRLLYGPFRPRRSGADHGRRATHQRAKPGQYPSGVPAGSAVADPVPLVGRRLAERESRSLLPPADRSRHADHRTPAADRETVRVLVPARAGDRTATWHSGGGPPEYVDRYRSDDVRGPGRLVSGVLYRHPADPGLFLQ